MIHHSILKLIGNTPMVEIKRLNPFKGITILAKLESFNPGGSIKDRIAKFMIEQAEKRGELTRDKVILEASSGNTGIGIALVAAVKGYNCTIAMSESASLERRKIMRAYGAEILLTPAARGTDGAIEKVYNMALEQPDRYFCTDQFNNPDNWKTHYHTTANEIWEQTHGKVDAIVITMGTTGTLMGITRRFRELNPDVRIIGLEPPLGHGIQGLKNMKESYKPGIYDKKTPDRIISCNDDEAFEYARLLARKEGIFAGMSSGAALAGALKIAPELPDGSTIVIIFPDGGERYLSTPLFDVPQELKCGAENRLKLTNSWGMKKECFEPLKSDQVRIYSCGPTACEYIGLNMARRLISADILVRVLEYLGHDTLHVMNITDVDDRTVGTSNARQIPLKELTDHYSEAFHRDAAALNIKGADIYPRASDHIQDMIEATKRVIELGYGYERLGSVYFDVSKLSDYGSLSRIDLKGIQPGRTVDLDEYDKDSPSDFILFKRVELQDLKRGIGWDTPWGKARPGWHIECATMSMKYLGDFFDIHTSGTNLIFPHHENETAIARALTGNRLAKYWLHSGLVRENVEQGQGENPLTLRWLYNQGYSGRLIRFFLLRSHYRKQISFSIKDLAYAAKGLERLDGFIDDLVSCLFLHRDRDVRDSIRYEMEKLDQEFLEFCLDDLNIPGAIGALFRTIRILNPEIADGQMGRNDAMFVVETLADLDQILAIICLPGPESWEITPELEDKLLRRQQAREQKDWSQADALRMELETAGFRIKDTPGGQRVIQIKSL